MEVPIKSGRRSDEAPRLPFGPSILPPPRFFDPACAFVHDYRASPWSQAILAPGGRRLRRNLERTASSLARRTDQRRSVPANSEGRIDGF